MQVANKPSQPGVRVIFHISPSVYITGILSAQRRGLKLDEFLDAAITAAASAEPTDPTHELPWSRHSMELFLLLADTLPESLHGPWRVLYAKVLQEPDLWKAPEASLDEVESGTADDEWRINETALAKAWPRLVSSVFAC
ncbi:hypothetical protein [Rhizobacter sp. SG703]|uniref:hypothetical protein n=1 Tax=Rhizobacter sp. SG703 TaxID=2587140 RepID=UPI001445654D|nr:hypothetical protein [Rhizobacter sp. SG703]NKI93507.1 hypothetical protein [Rhizobacter sp. SG703]